MKVGVLTSSRADYGIYLPLLKELQKDPFFELEIIAFGTHLSKNHGFTLKNILDEDFDIIYQIKSLSNDDSQKGIVMSYSNTIKEFSKFWYKNKFDLVFCLGDRFEMSAAVQSLIPFGIKLAHIHGGETTLGAIDNIYRHQISLASNFHFVSSKNHMIRVKQIIGDKKNIYNVGSLSLNNIEKFKPVEKNLFFKKFKLMMKPFLLVTFHPETISVKNNYRYAEIMRDTIKELLREFQIVITMPNADTLGSIFRKELNKLNKKGTRNLLLVESFGKENYFSAMEYCSLIIGNSSSGIIEAASFKKYVINVGNRQKGRDKGKNVYNVNFNSKKIIDLTYKLLNFKPFEGENIYYKKNCAKRIIRKIKDLNL